jgi:hypothetical protein
MNKSLYIFNQNNYILHFVTEGESEKIYKLAEKIKKDDICSFWISSESVWDGWNLLDCLKFAN